MATGFPIGPSTTVVLGSMGAGYGGTGQSLTYEESISFALNGGNFGIDLLNGFALGNGFDSAKFQILLNGNVIESQSFATRASAEPFFSSDLINIALAGSLNNIEMLFDETMSSPSGFGFNYAAGYVSSGPAVTPLLAAWTMLLPVIIGPGFTLNRQRKARSCSR